MIHIAMFEVEEQGEPIPPAG